MICTKCGSELSAHQSYCGDCGSPRPRWPAAFESAAARFGPLRQRHESGGLTEEQYEAALEELVLQDGSGAYWMIGAQTAQWYRHDGKAWLPTDPPLAEPQPAPQGTPRASGQPRGRQDAAKAEPVASAARQQAAPVTRRNRGKRVLILAIVLVGASLLLALLGLAFRNSLVRWALDHGWAHVDTAASSVPAAQAPVVTMVVTSEPAPGDAPSFGLNEWFDDNRAGWLEAEAPYRTAWLENGEYHVLVKEAMWEGPLYYPGRTFGDVAIGVRVRFEGEARGWGGLALGIDDSCTGCYLFCVYRDGSWSLEKRLGTDWTTLLKGDTSGEVKPAGQSNYLQMTRAGSEIIVAANGVRLGSVHDDSLPEGYVGVVAGALDAGAHLVFDDFAVESPD